MLSDDSLWDVWWDVRVEVRHPPGPGAGAVAAPDLVPVLAVPGREEDRSGEHPHLQRGKATLERGDADRARPSFLHPFQGQSSAHSSVPWTGSLARK